MIFIRSFVVDSVKWTFNVASSVRLVSVFHLGTKQISRRCEMNNEIKKLLSHRPYCRESPQYDGTKTKTKTKLIKRREKTFYFRWMKRQFVCFVGRVLKTRMFSFIRFPRLFTRIEHASFCLVWLQSNLFIRKLHKQRKKMKISLNIQPQSQHFISSKSS